MHSAIEGERERQIELLEMGRPVIQETRRWDDNKESSHAMRSKEDAQDYRYFPEPDLVPIIISDEWLAASQSTSAGAAYGETGSVIRKILIFRIMMHRSLPRAKKLADIFEATTAICKKPKKVSNWLMVETMRLMKEHEHGS